MPYTVFFGFYALSLVAAVCIGIRLMSGRLLSLWRPALGFVRHNYIFIVVLAAAPLLVQFTSVMKTSVSDPAERMEALGNASWIFSIGGGTLRTIQTNIDSDLAAGYFSFVYMWAFAFFTYFLPVLLVAKGDRRNLSYFTLAVALNYAVLIPFYLVFPVAVSSQLPGTGVHPMLYSTPYWGQMATSVDSLTNCFPSGHVSLSFTALFVFALAGTQYRRLAYALAAVAVNVAVAVLYLGIHYPADVLGGLALAGGASLLATNELIRTHASRLIRSIQLRAIRQRS